MDVLLSYLNDLIMYFDELKTNNNQCSEESNKLNTRLRFYYGKFIKEDEYCILNNYCKVFYYINNNIDENGNNIHTIQVINDNGEDNQQQQQKYHSNEENILDEFIELQDHSMDNNSTTTIEDIHKRRNNVYLYNDNEPYYIIIEMFLKKYRDTKSCKDNIIRLMDLLFQLVDRVESFSDSIFDYKTLINDIKKFKVDDDNNNNAIKIRISFMILPISSIELGNDKSCYFKNRISNENVELLIVNQYDDNDTTINICKNKDDALYCLENICNQLRHLNDQLSIITPSRYKKTKRSNH
jgi:hypothetical protein